MVKRTMNSVLVCCALAVVLAQPITASAASYTLYDGELVPSYASIFRDLVGKISPMEDYVFFRSGEYDYTLIAGELECIAGIFEAPVCTVYRLYVSPDGSAGYQLFQSEETDFILETGTGLVYSNLGHYPDLIDQTSFYSFASLVLLLACVGMYLLRSIFSFTLRRH